MRPKLILFVCVAVGNVLFGLHGAMANYDEYIDIDSDAESSNSGETKENYGKGGDDEDGSGVMSEESGSGSGEPSTSTDDPNTVDVTVESVATTESATSAQGEATTEPSNEITDAGETTKGTSGVDENESEDEDVFGGGVGGDTMALQKKDKDLDNTAGEKEVMKVLTTEVIAAVVVGAVCAVILIAFLVYRLRKRDEGSYSLSEYKDTYKLHADTGKEAFV
ncbi:PREDICTED: syndecan-2-B-like [Acropora digitifera]|uniref:syndecan-2-B-like n=1 Tax=Acropora digitifera TaxID=70779 RepID=UPI00077A98B0|nr:PREDICTED: syndecan-2-B-like [Acropora digitifera]